MLSSLKFGKAVVLLHLKCTSFTNKVCRKQMKMINNYRKLAQINVRTKQGLKLKIKSKLPWKLNYYYTYCVTYFKTLSNTVRFLLSITSVYTNYNFQ